MKRLHISFFLLTAALSSGVQALEILRWERLPLAVPLLVDQERVVFIDRNVRVGVPPSISDKLRVQSAGGAVYLRASAPIKPTRLQLQDADTGTLILLDIAAEAAEPGQAFLEPVRIVEAEGPTPRYRGSPADEDTDETGLAADLTPHETPVPVVLTRYAAQSLYAPLRTLEPVPGITQVNLRRSQPLDTLLPTLPIKAVGLSAWRLGNLWVTAARLKNTSVRWQELDPRALQGNFVTATFQHAALGPAGTPEDTTVVYLVTHSGGLDKALLPAISQIDATLTLPAASDQGDGHER
ncbi:TIGR03749 family integrating conjugative element protein [Pseudomonas sp. TNT2022 ID357]|uniref:TIGR03749 family integrating conjugative element protein n=1 Tax=Pseudomonas idahonensis TaxID=2942628 RepID=A0ABT5Q3P9_9PSED|nr:TIGR03749 family integrating conjugative element protein [Pseudomonas idahonensis]MDD1148823.1 TIGR03749 family integrating conjugative element protein [Pseudomonas idahonensis]